MPRKITPRRHQNAPKQTLKIKIRKNDTVMIIAGEDAGKTGRVIEVDRDKGRVLVEGRKLVKKHVRPNPQKQIKGGIAEREAPIHVSNVMLVNADGKPTRVGTRVEGTGAGAKRVRVARKGGETLDKKG